MAKFGVVGDYLRQKYHNGILVTVDQSGNELVVAEAMYPRKPAREDLVFLEESPDYCVRNTNTGSLGTTGRYCNKTSLGHGSCGVLCCGRGFNTIQIEQEFKCGCKFQWCCHVRCNTCRKTVDKHMCKSPEENDRVRGSSLQFSSDSVVRKESNKQNKQSSSRSAGKRIDRRRKAKKNRNNQRRGSPSPIDNTVDGGDHRDTSWGSDIAKDTIRELHDPVDQPKTIIFANSNANQIRLIYKLGPVSQKNPEIFRVS